jgi:branched-chain amino acid transport system substrate-binding protein
VNAAFAQNKGEVKIALIASKSGPLEAYAKQTIVGFNLGLEYATGGTMMVAGKKLVVIEKDDQGKPDVGKNLLAAAYADDKVDIAVGPTASPWRWPCCRWPRNTRRSCWWSRPWPTITGDKWNKYIFRTGRNSSQDAIANAVALDQPGTSIATLAQDNAFGKRRRQGLQGARSRRPRSCTRNTCPRRPPTSPPAGQRIIDKLKDQPGKKVVWIIWAGGNPFKIADMDLKRYGIEIATGGNILPAMVAYKQFPGMEGALYYYFGIPKNPVNEWLVAATTSSSRRRRTSSPPAAWPRPSRWSRR